jgi:4-hydroxy-tetrahydrodipicolinate reductase
MALRVAVAGATGWAGSAMVRAVLDAPDMTLTGAVARGARGRDAGAAVGRPAAGVTIAGTVAEALETETDVLIDYTHPAVVLRHIEAALAAGVHVVVGTSGLAAADYAHVDAWARSRGRGVVAAGNFSLTAALAKHAALLAARHIPHWELVEYGSWDKVDAPGGTVRELAEALGEVGEPPEGVAAADTLGVVGTRGDRIAGTRVHVVRLPGYVLSFEAHFGLPAERLVIRHEAGDSAAPYVAGTLLAVRRVVDIVGVVRGLDRLLFEEPAVADG